MINFGTLSISIDKAKELYESGQITSKELEAVMKKSLFHECLSIAISKMHNHPQYENFIHFSFIVQNNKIVGYGRNNCATPPKHQGYHSRVPTPKTHSEINAYKKVKGILEKDKD